MPLTIRPALPGDIAEMRYVLAGCGLAADVDTSIIAGGVVLVAVHDGQVIGLIQCLIGRPCSYITYLAVLPGSRFNGRTMLALVQEMERHLRAIGATHWLADIADDDPAWQGAVTRWGAVKAARSSRLYRKALNPVTIPASAVPAVATPA
jgi:hypothetical protein